MAKLSLDQSQLIRWDLGGAVAAIQAGDFNPNSASIFLTDEAQALESEMGHPPTASLEKKYLLTMSLIQ